MKESTVDQLWVAGFPIGPRPIESCGRCPHAWGPHRLLAVTDDPRGGGTWLCPEEDCDCTGTWSLPGPKVCQWGRKLESPQGDVCPDIATHVIIVAGVDDATVDLTMCAMHVAILDNLGVIDA
jgi:hypothetical protein